MNSQDGKKVTIRGIVIPTDWDEKGNVAAIAVSGFDEVNYLVEKDKTGKQLLALLQQSVEVVGIMREENGMKKIKIKTYCLKNREADFDIH
jgi:hypothetical protein